LNRGFFYGDGFFETVFWGEGKLPLLDYHLARAQRTAQWLEMVWPKAWTSHFWKTEIERRNISQNPVIRMDFFRKGSGLYVPDSEEIEMSISFRIQKTTSTYFTEVNTTLEAFEARIQTMEYVPVSVYHEQQKPITAWSSFKSTSALFYVKAGLFLNKQKRAEDLILLNTDGNLCEGLSSNVLIKIGENWHSPAQNQGPIEGVFLAYLQSFLPIQRSAITIPMLEQAQEILFLNAIQGVRKIELIG